VKTTLFLLFLLIASLIIVIPISHMGKAQTSQQPTVVFSPLTVNATQLDQTFTLSIDISNVQNLWGWLANVTYDSEYIKVENSSEGAFLTSQGATTLYLATPPHNYKDPYSNIETLQQVTLQDAIDSSSNGEQDSASGSGVLASLTFEAIKQTSSTSITLEETLEGPNPTTGAPISSNPIITPVSPTSTTVVSLIIPGPPTANAGQEQSVTAGTTVTLDGSHSVSTGSNTTYTWTFIDGTPKTLTGMTVKYTFNNPGNYTVTLTVKDSLGTSDSTVMIHVLGVSATATPTPTTTQAPTSTSTPTPTPTYTPSPTPTPQQTTGSFSLPPTIIGILGFVTILTLIGSFFWLRKQT
jgi:hypothetical protein